MSSLQFPHPYWLPWHCNAVANRVKPGIIRAYGYIRLPGQRFLSWNMDVDYDEVLLWRFGFLTLTRPETAQESQERQEAEAEEAFMERELNRYTEWYY